MCLQSFTPLKSTDWFPRGIPVRSHFLRMVEVSVQPDRVILLQHVYQLIGNSHRHNYRSSGAESYDFNVRYLSQFADDVFKRVILNTEAVSA